MCIAHLRRHGRRRPSRYALRRARPSGGRKAFACQWYAGLKITGRIARFSMDPSVRTSAPAIGFGDHRYRKRAEKSGDLVDRPTAQLVDSKSFGDFRQNSFVLNPLDRRAAARRRRCVNRDRRLRRTRHPEIKGLLPTLHWSPLLVR